jgi:O-antigen/teichoic acid export membrane protein
VKSLYATALVACAVAVPIAVLASFGVRLVYGPAFAGSVASLRVLLVGAVLYSAAATVCSGLYAINRPFTAGMAQLTAAAFTVAGLLLFLKRGGILAAAIVSTVAYGLVLAIALVLYCRATGLAWRDVVLTPSRMRIWAHQAARGALGRV